MDHSYLTTIPCELQEKIIRCLSKKPKCEQWIHYIAAEDFETICSLKSTLFLELKRNLKSITKTRSSFLGNQKTCLFSSILEEVQSTISSVNVYSQSSHMRHSLSWISTLENCDSLKSLRLCVRLELDTFETLISKRGAHLKSFSIRLFGIKGFIRLISDNCKHLEKLELLDPHEDCTQLWESLKDSLKQLSLQIWRSDPNTGNIREIEKHCRSLKSINISLPWFCSEYQPIAELYASYSAQLQEANLSAMTGELCAYVASKCKNARFTISSLNDVISRMYTLGPNLSAVEFSCSIDTDIESLREVSKRCPNIETMKYIETISTTTGYLRALLTHPKTSLHSLDLRHSKGLDEQTLDDLSAGTGNLERFSCTLYLSSGISFEQFAAANKRLKEIEFYLKPTRSSPRRLTLAATPVIHNIFESFRKSTSLEEIKIQSTFPFQLERFYGGMQIPVFKKLRKSLRSSGIYVEIFGIYYD